MRYAYFVLLALVACSDGSPSTIQDGTYRLVSLYGHAPPHTVEEDGFISRTDSAKLVVQGTGFTHTAWLHVGAADAPVAETFVAHGTWTRLGSGAFAFQETNGETYFEATYDGARLLVSGPANSIYER